MISKTAGVPSEAEFRNETSHFCAFRSLNKWIKLSILESPALPASTAFVTPSERSTSKTQRRIVSRHGKNAHGNQSIPE